MTTIAVDFTEVELILIALCFNVVGSIQNGDFLGTAKEIKEIKQYVIDNKGCQLTTAEKLLAACNLAGLEAEM